jgi:hypothetical protein
MSKNIILVKDRKLKFYLKEIVYGAVGWIHVWMVMNLCREAEQVLPSKEGLSFVELVGYTIVRPYTYADVTTKATAIVELENGASAIPMFTYWAVCVYVQ